MASNSQLFDQSFDCKQLAVWLNTKGIEQDVCQVLAEYDIDGESFLYLTKEVFKDILPNKVGTFLKIQIIQKKIKKSLVPSSQSSVLSSQPIDNDDGDDDDKSILVNLKDNDDDDFEDAFSEIPDSKPTAQFDFSDVPSLNANEFSEWLSTQGLFSEDCKSIKDQNITADVLAQLDEEEIKELTPKMGSRKKLQNLKKRLMALNKDGPTDVLKSNISEISTIDEADPDDVDVPKLDCVGLSKWLEVKGYSSKLCENFKGAEINGELFMNLSKEDLISVGTTLGVALQLQSLQTKLKETRISLDKSVKPDSSSDEVDVSTLDCKGFIKWLKAKKISAKGYQALKDADINGECFLQLSKEDLQSIVPSVGLIMQLQKLQAQHNSAKSHVPSTTDDIEPVSEEVTKFSDPENVEVQTLNSEELVQWLQIMNIPIGQAEIHAFKENVVDGKNFLKLTEDQLKGIVNPLGIRMSIQELQEKVKRKYQSQSGAQVTNASSVDVSALDCIAFVDFLKEQQFSPKVCQVFKANMITGTQFLKLSEKSLQELVESEEITVKLRSLQQLQLQEKDPHGALAMILQHCQLLPSAWVSHLSIVKINSPKDLDKHKGSTTIYKALLKCTTTDEEKTGLKCLLDITDDMLIDPDAKKAEFTEFLQILGLNKKFPKELKVKDAMLIRLETTGNIKYTDQIQLLPYVILRKIFMYDSRSRSALFNGNLQKTTVINNLTDIHPMDSFLALLHCCDNFLRQEILSKLTTCQMAIPLLLPNPHDGSVEFLLWAMRSIIKSWKSQAKNGKVEAKEYRIIDYQTPIISFLKFGKLKYSKSKMLNEVISDSKEDYFFHWDCEGGSSTRLFIDGLVEMCCYLPSGKNNVDDFYQDILFLCNLHGDAQNHIMQIQFVEKISFMAFLLLSEDDVNENSAQVIYKLSKIPGGLILIFPELRKDQHFKNKETERLLGSMHVLKLGGKNSTLIRHEIRQEVESKLMRSKTQHKTLSDCIDIAHSLDILVDEDDEDCCVGKDLAENMMEVVRSIPITEAKQKMLPLQGESSWHKWASLDKEFYRQLEINKTKLNVKEYGKDIEKKKIKIRENQNKLLTQAPTKVMDTFVNSLIGHAGAKRLYFVHWLKMFLDDYSRQKLPGLSATYHNTREELLRLKEQGQHDTEQVKTLRETLKKQNDQLIHASFGLEHLFREMGQIYEAGMDPEVTVSKTVRNKIAAYPQVVVQLMEEGYPVELMDGDASHVPKTWVLAVLSHLKSLRTKSNKIFVISVLGIQSTGKSTLLNTVFGLHFNVSAGRCTRGAYFQLLPLNDSLRQQTNCHSLLILDTEGLRAPELQQKDTQKHDNELATLVIGLADVTIINIYGESPGDLSGILETAVHAFIRMKQVDIQLSCHFVHQNVPAIMADKKGKFGRQQFQDKLDTMTKIAAQGEACNFTSFKEVIHFNSEQDVTFFPSLWKGDPPMAPVNPGYSDKACNLKQALLTLAANKEEHCTIDTFQARLNKLWEAVLREKFVFSFKNSLEVIAYNHLDMHYSQWSWELKRKMLESQVENTNMISSCDVSKIEETMQSCVEKTQTDLDNKWQELKTKIENFFTGDENAETLIQWRQHTEVKLFHLVEEHKHAAKKYCVVLKLNREGRAKVDEIQHSYRKTLHDSIDKLIVAINAQKINYTAEQRQKFFDDQWQKWIDKLSENRSEVVYTTDAGIYDSIRRVLKTILDKHDHIIIRRLGDTPLASRGSILHLTVIPADHLNSQRWTKWLKSKFTTQPPQNIPVKEEDIHLANVLTEQYLKDAEENIEKAVNRLQDYDGNVVHDILMKLTTSIKQYNDDSNVYFKFTSYYVVDIAIIVASFAGRKLKEMVHKLRVENDPIESLKKLRRIFFRTFESQFTDASNDRTAADNLCNLLMSSIQKALMESLRIEIVEDMKNGADYKRKNCFKIKILEDLAKRKSFDLYTTFLTSVSASFRDWSKVYVREHCKMVEDGETKLVKLAKQLLSTTIKDITVSVKHLEKSYKRDDDSSVNCDEVMSIASSDNASKIDDNIGDDEDSGEHIDINLWLNEFYETSKDKLVLDLKEMKEMIGVKKLKDINRFTKLFLKGLSGQEAIILEEYKDQNSKSAKVTDWDRPPHFTLYNSLQGCREQCPFCKEQCEYTDEDHINGGKAHFTEIHRPECLGRYTWRHNKELVLDICTESIESNATFCNSDTKDKFIPYKEYNTIYKNWFISNEKPKTGPIYWQWFCFQFQSKVEEWVGSNPTNMKSKGWNSLSEEDALKSLADIYASKV